MAPVDYRPRPVDKTPVGPFNGLHREAKRMKIRHFAALAAGFTAAATGLAHADPVALKYAFPAPPSSMLAQWGMGPYTEDINREAGGEIEMKLFYGPSLANF